MQALPSAFAFHASRPSRRLWPFDWTAKSTMVVVPPKAAARVPVSNVSLANVPPNGSSMWVWTSMAPGITYLPDASIVASAVTPLAARSVPSWAMVSPSTRTSAGHEPSAVTTVPFAIRVRIGPPRARGGAGPAGAGRSKRHPTETRPMRDPAVRVLQDAEPRVDHGADAELHPPHRRGAGGRGD